MVDLKLYIQVIFSGNFYVTNHLVYQLLGYSDVEAASTFFFFFNLTFIPTVFKYKD